MSDVDKVIEAWAREKHEATGPWGQKYGWQFPKQGASPVGYVTWDDAPEDWKQGYRDLCRKEAGLG